jgi:hypothetical protein
MNRLFLTAGVAALAIATAAAAKPGGGNGGGPHGGGGGAPQAQQQGGGGGHGHGGGGGGAVFMGGGGHGHGGGRGGGFVAPQMNRGGGPRFQAFQQRGHGGGGGFAAPRVQQQRFAMPRQQRQQMRVQRQAQNRGFERQQMRVQRQAQAHGFERQQMHVQRQAQNRGFERQQLRANRMQEARNRGFERQQMRAQRMQQAQNGGFDRQQLRAQRMQQFQQQQTFANQQFNAPAFTGRGKFRGNEQQFVNYQQQAYQQALAGTSFAPLYYGTSSQILAPTIVEQFIGVPVQTVSSFATLSPFPASVQYLYPATSDYYYQYGDGYAYQIDRGTNLISALFPLLAGGYLPGQYLPQPYMASYVPDYYGFNSFYPDYGDTCNRYANGVIYEVDCYTGMVEDVIPMYAGGYGVGQMLPSSYAYYNVPAQYRTMYYDTPDYNYWYAPGAIYQYDPQSSMITSVAALLSPGFTVGQQLPMGYDVYNVPYAYRSTYYDTQNAWYRYNNGYIYQVDPVTQVVTAIVASLLT